MDSQLIENKKDNAGRRIKKIEKHDELIKERKQQITKTIKEEKKKWKNVMN